MRFVLGRGFERFPCSLRPDPAAAPGTRFVSGSFNRVIRKVEYGSNRLWRAVSG
jgi:hypothetical protein